MIILLLLNTFLSAAQIRLSKVQAYAEGAHFISATVYDARMLQEEYAKTPKSVFLIKDAEVTIASKDVEKSESTRDLGYAWFFEDFKSAKLEVSVSKKGYKDFSETWRLTRTMEYIEVFITPEIETDLPGQ